MDITITQLDCDQTIPNHGDCVKTVHYTIVKTDSGYTALESGTVSLSEPENTFTPFSDLTKAQVIEWCNFDLAAIESRLDQKIQAQKNPPIVSKPAPWVTWKPSDKPVSSQI